jgi:prevent-host-death family protein
MDEYRVPVSSSVRVSEAREELSELVNRVAYGHERIVLVRHGKEVAALVPASDAALLDALEDELDLTAVREALADPANTGPVTLQEVRARLGL